MKRPYSPSWADRFLDWLLGLPFPYWVSVLLIYLISVTAFHIALIIDGKIVVGQIDPTSTLNGLWSIVGIFFLLTLDRMSNIAIDKFSVLVPGKKRELEVLRYKMTTLPPIPSALFSVGVVVLLGLGVIFEPAFLGVSHPLAMVIVFVIMAASYSFAPVMLYQGLRQLNLVIQAYRLVDKINLFHLQPLYAFSSLTLTSSLFWVVILNFNYVSNYSGQAINTVDMILSILLSFPYVVLAIITFIVPLWGIHRRIQNKKEAALEENGMQIEKTHQALYRHLNKGEYSKGSELEKALTSLYKMREQIEKVHTWPWNTGTLRGFLSAVFLPLGVWLAQQVLSRFL